MEQRQLKVGDRPVAHLRAPLTAVARLIGTQVRHLVGAHVQELAARADHVGSRQEAAHRRQFGTLPLVLHITAQGELRVDAVRRRELPHRQQHLFDLDPRLRRLDRVGRVLYAVHARVVQAFTPGLDMPTGFDIEHGVVFKAPAAEHIGVEQARAPATVVAGIAGELVVVTVLVDGGR